MALCTSDEVVTAEAQDLCPKSMQAAQDGKSICRSHQATIQIMNHKSNNITTTADWLVRVNVPFKHKYGYIRDERSVVESYPYPVKEGQRYINLNTGHLFLKQPPKKEKGLTGSLKVLC